MGAPDGKDRNSVADGARAAEKSAPQEARLGVQFSRGSVALLRLDRQRRGLVTG